MIKNDTINLFFKTAISILLVSNHNSSLALEMASPGNQHCDNCIGTLSFPTLAAGDKYIVSNGSMLQMTSGIHH